MQKIKSTRSPTELVVQICGPDFCHYVSSQCKFLLSYCKACQVSTNTFLPFTFCLRCLLRSLLHFFLNQTTHKQTLQISVFFFFFFGSQIPKHPLSGAAVEETHLGWRFEAQCGDHFCVEQFPV